MFSIQLLSECHALSRCPGRRENRDLTHYGLDEKSFLGEHSDVKSLTTAGILALGALAALSSSCRRDDALDAQRLEELRALNEQLGKEISHMEANISRVGSERPSLDEDIRTREKEINDLRLRLSQQKDEIYDANVRLIALRSRLSEFRHDFSVLQNEAASDSAAQSGGDTQQPLAQP